MTTLELDIPAKKMTDSSVREIAFVKLSSLDLMKTGDHTTTTTTPTTTTTMSDSARTANSTSSMATDKDVLGTGPLQEGEKEKEKEKEKKEEKEEENQPHTQMQSTEDCHRSASPIRTMGLLVMCVVLGFVFGVALEKSRVFEPKSIRLQMVFERWIMLKMFLAALASSLLSLAILSLLPCTQRKFRHASDVFIRCLTDKGVVTSGVGAFFLGVGMTVSGACPGMVLAQVGAWVPNAIFTLGGCLLGALLYGMAAPLVDSWIRPRHPFVHQQVHRQLHRPFALLAVPLGLGLAVVVVLMEVFVDYTDELERPEELSTNVIRTIAWPPFVGGVLIGVLQIPMVLLLEDTLGGSSSYVTVMSQWVVTSSLQEKFPYLARMRTGVGNWWQVLYVGGAIIGGLLSALSSGSLGETEGVGVLEAFFGGLLMLLGARLAAGCTSGHGISGVSLLAWLSWLAVPFMFAGAIIVAFIMRAAGGSLDRLVNATLTM